MESLMRDDRFHNNHWIDPPDISSWPIVTPVEVAKQDNKYIICLHFSYIYMCAVLHCL